MQGGTASSCETKREREIVDGDFPPLNLIYALMRGVKTDDKIRAGEKKQLKLQSKHITILNAMNKFFITLRFH